MVPQEQLDQFVRDFCAFMGELQAYGIKSVRVKETPYYVLGKIEEEHGGEAIELWSEDGEIRVVYSQSHWHIDEQWCSIIKKEFSSEVEQDVFDIIDGTKLTYSVWQGEQALGGGDVNGTIDEAIRHGTKDFPTATSVHVKQWCKALVKVDVVQKNEAHPVSTLERP